MAKRNTIITILALIMGFSLWCPKTFAEEMGSTMLISPPRQKIVLIPGETYEGSIKVSTPANASQDLKYSVEIGSFNLGKDENGGIDYNDTDVDSITSYNQIMDWITLGKTEGSVGANQSDIIPFSISVPEDAPGGGQYATIIVQDDTESESGEGNVAIQNVIRFASTIIAEVAGETREKGSVIENNIPSFLLSSPLNATSMVRNDGNVHTDASYTLQVWPLFSGEEICTNEEEPTTSLIMPETERYHLEKCDLPPIGIFRAKQTVKIFGEISTVEKTIIVCPLWLLFIVVFAIVSIIIWLVIKAKNRKNSR